MNLYRRVIGYYRPYLGTICFSMVLLIVGVAFSLLKYWPVQWVIDHVVTVGAGGTVHWQFLTMSASHAALFAAVAMVVIYVLAGLLGFWRNYVSIEVGLKALLELRTQLYSYLQYLPLHFHDRRRSGDSTFRVAYDSQAIQTFYNRGFDTVFGSVITLLMTFAVMAKMDAVLAGVSLLILPLLWITIYFFSARVRRQTTTLQQEESDVLARASEGLTSIRIVHAFGQEEYEVREFVREARQSYAANLSLTITNAISTLAISGVMALGLSLVLYVATLHILDGRLTVGQLTLFLAYVAMLYQPLEQLSYTAWALEGAAAGMQRVFEILDAEDSVPEMPGAKPMPRARGEIAFENVAFAYETDHPILRGITLSMKPGQTVALVGGTGAGKTTLLSLVPRFYDPNAGRVLIDGNDVRERDEEIAAGEYLRRAAGHAAAFRHGAGEYRLWPARCDPRRDSGRGGSGAGARLHREITAWLRDAGRRARRAAQRRTKAANRPGAGLPEKRADPVARRTDQRARSRDRGGNHGDAQGADAALHHADRDAPAQHDSSRRLHSCARGGTRGRIGHGAGIAGTQGRLRAALECGGVGTRVPSRPTNKSDGRGLPSYPYRGLAFFRSFALNSALL